MPQSLFVHVCFLHVCFLHVHLNFHYFQTTSTLSGKVTICDFYNTDFLHSYQRCHGHYNQLNVGDKTPVQTEDLEIKRITSQKVSMYRTGHVYSLCLYVFVLWHGETHQCLNISMLPPPPSHDICLNCLYIASVWC